MTTTQESRPCSRGGSPGKNTNSTPLQDTSPCVSLTNRQGFRAWLTANQNHPNNLVRSLAYDAKDDDEFPVSDHFAAYERYFEEIGACRDAHNALIEAWSFYRPDAYNPHREDDRTRDVLRLIGYEFDGYEVCRRSQRSRIGCELWSDPSPNRNNSIILHVYGCPRFDTLTEPAPLQLDGAIRDLFGEEYRNWKAKRITQAIKHSGEYVSRQKFAKALLGETA